MTSRNHSRKAFTLIELLIVVAIIAILAAIAVPNFLEAQVRSKVSRTKADMRSMATALEAYYTDNNAYPNCHQYGITIKIAPSDPPILERLSTPIAYMTTVLIRDPFTIKGRQTGTNALAVANAPITPVLPGPPPSGDPVANINSYIYQSWNAYQRYCLPNSYSSAGGSLSLPTKSNEWLLHSAGPDGVYHNLGGVIATDVSIDGPILLIYDPTNGTVSRGSVYRAGGQDNIGIPASSFPAAGHGLRLAIDTQQ